MQTTFQRATLAQVPITLVGAGSNLLISDDGIRGAGDVYPSGSKNRISDDAKGQITVAAGEPLPTVAWKVAKRGWRGLEWAAGIPGTIGGAVVMNAGAHGGCTAEQLVSATVIDPQRGVLRLTPEALGFRYRTSALQDSGAIVLEATFQPRPRP